jgi:choline kinase
MGRFTTSITENKSSGSSAINVNISVAILSAGIGMRIKSYEPRSMLKICDKTLIEHQISTIRNCFKDIDLITVVGYESGRIIKKLSDKHIRIIENQSYETTNTAESIRLAFNNNIRNGFLFIHGDLLFNPETLNQLNYKKSFILIDNNNMLEDKEVGVTIDANNKATILSYDLPTKWCQIAFITGKELKIASHLFNRFEDSNKKMLSFEVLNKMIEMGASFECYEPKKMKIMEIDRIKDIVK